MTNEQIGKLLALAQLIELHGKLGGTKPFDRLLAPVSAELHDLTDEIEEEFKAKQDAKKAEVDQAKAADQQKLQTQAEREADQAEKAKARGAKQAEIEKYKAAHVKANDVPADQQPPAWIEPVAPENEIDRPAPIVERRL